MSGFTDGMDRCKSCGRLKEYRHLHDGSCINRADCIKGMEELERFRKKKKDLRVESSFGQDLANMFGGMFTFFSPPPTALEKIRQDLKKSPKELWTEDWAAVSADFKKVLGEKH